MLCRGKYRRLCLVVARLLGQARYRVVQGLEIGQDQLGVDRLDVVGRRDSALHVHDVVVVKRAEHLTNRIGFTNVCQELVPQPRSFRSALHDSGDVDEGDGGGDDFRRVEDSREMRQTRIGHTDNTGVRLDRRERVVRGEHVILRQGVKQRRFANIRQSDDS